jgi:SSS family transporter
MRLADWVVLCGALSYVVLYGLWRGRETNTVNKYLLAGRSMPWHVVGLSIMATQASAITFVSHAGQSYVDGMRFVQFYFGLPIAMFILAYTAVPMFHRAKVYTAYEFLEKRFDARTRALVSAIFLTQRGLALGIALYAPAVVLTVILGWPDWLTTVLMGGIAVAYATEGGAKAIAWSDFQQMLVMTAGLAAAFLSAVWLMPSHVSFADAVSLANVASRLNVITTTMDWNDRYNLWSGLIGGTFLALAYFGTDQSQVQRYLSGRSISESRRGLFFNAAAKIPMQLFILFIGAMVFVFYIYEKPPILFQPIDRGLLTEPGARDAFAPIERDYDEAFSERQAAADRVLTAKQSFDMAGRER